VPFDAFRENPGVGYCFVNIQIGHNRAEESYTDTWYDVIDAGDDEEYLFYYEDVATIHKPLYFTVETYGFNIIPYECTTGYDTETGEYSQTPVVTFSVSWGDDGDDQITKEYLDY